MARRASDIRFGIEVDGKRSRCWRVRAGARLPELYVEREGLERAAHISLHASGRWHLKVERNQVRQWVRPTELTPGYTRALVISQSVSVATIELAAHPTAKLICVTPDSEPVHFNIFIERPGANLHGWPGKNAMGSTFVGRIELANDVGTCCVVAHQGPIQPGSANFPAPAPAVREQMKEAARDGHLYGTVMFKADDGTAGFLDGKFSVEPSGPSVQP
ncbi:hypothetical protein JOF56_001876 [Kibdelosporangium banguiense]|uniref:Uncharacterized protein n=1 Tax=Kibdelosporangium banguiense TaxID=1365924 RepID=A0ABS4TCC6_9PSEU|nr:hypothetical protein [Kibdelosporangium banguiense]